VDYLPSPLDIPPVICAVEKEANQRMADDSAPFSGMAFKIMSDKHMGKLTYIRIYSGTLKQGEAVYNATRDRTQRVGRLLRMHANKQEPLDSISRTRARSWRWSASATPRPATPSATRNIPST